MTVIQRFRPTTPAVVAPARGRPLLEVRDLRTYFHVMDGVVRAVDGISFQIMPGETLGIVGESGCGKSVTSLSIMRLLDMPPAEIPTGEILFEGRDLLQLPDEEMRKVRGNDIAMIFQEPMTSLNPVFTVGDQIAEAVILHQGLSKKTAWDKAIESIKSVGINNPERRVKQYPHELSGGMRQRVMIAMALSCDPKLLIADEPTTALDVTIQAQILELIRDVQDRTGAALMLITHDLGVVAETVKDVVVMYAGRIVEEGSVEEVLLAPKHPYTEGLLGSIPSRGKRGVRLNVIHGTVPNPFNMPPGCNFAPRCPYTFEPCTQSDPRIGDANPPDVACWLYTPAPGSTHAAAGPAPARPRRGPRVTFETNEPTTGTGAPPASPVGAAAASTSAPMVTPVPGRPPTAEVPLVEIEGLVKYYPIMGGFLRRHVGDVKAVDGVSFWVNRGEVLGLVGESGCGKSTLGRTLIQLQPPTAGIAKLDGEPIFGMKGKELKLLRRRMQIIFQDPVGSLNPRMPISDIIGEGLLAQADKENRWGDRKVRDKRVGDYLDAVGLRRDYTRRYPHEFSGGQRQRIGIARALAP